MKAAITALIEAADQIRAELARHTRDLGSLSPNQLEMKLGVKMKDTSQGDRLEALLKFLNSRRSNLRLQMRFELGSRLVFGSFWLPGETRLVTMECPKSLAFYLEVPQQRSVNSSFGRELQAALTLLAGELEIGLPELLRCGGVLMLERHHACVTAIIGDKSARLRHAEKLEELAKKGVFWEEVAKALRLAREEVTAS